MMIQEAQMAAHENSKTKGFWETEHRNIGMKLALIHSEVSEALEEYRNDRPLGEIYYENGKKPCGFPSELADIVIRVFDLAGYLGIDMSDMIKEKLIYNETRDYLHGGKKA